MSKIGIAFAGAIAVFAVAALPASAQAEYVYGSGYACRASYLPPNGNILVYGGPNQGQFGTVSVTIYSQPYCAGTFVRGVTAFSTGSNVANFTNAQVYYGEAELMALWQNLEHAANAGEPVSFSGQHYTYSMVLGQGSGTQLTSLTFGNF